MTAYHSDYDADLKRFVNEHSSDFRTAKEALPKLLGFVPDRGFRLPLEPVRSVISAYLAAHWYWMCGVLRRPEDSEEPNRVEVLTRYEGLQASLADLYAFLAAYDCCRCPIPIGEDKLGAYSDFQELTRTLHAWIPHAPARDVEFVFVGQHDSRREHPAASASRTKSQRQSQQRKRRTYAEFVAKFLGSDWPGEPESERRDATETTVNPELLPALLGFSPARSYRLPIEPVRDLMEAYDEAAAFWDCRMGTPRNVGELIAYPALKTACAKLYAIVATYGARRICVPVGPSLVGLRKELSELVTLMHTAVSDAPKIEVDVVFVGQRALNASNESISAGFVEIRH